MRWENREGCELHYGYRFGVGESEDIHIQGVFDRIDMSNARKGVDSHILY